MAASLSRFRAKSAVGGTPEQPFFFFIFLLLQQMGGTQNSPALPPLSKEERAVTPIASRLPPREAMEAHSSGSGQSGAAEAAERAAARLDAG